MRVLHVAPSVSPLYGGPAESLVGLVRAATAAGVEVSIAAPRPSNHHVDWLASRIGSTPLHLFSSLGTGAFVAAPGLWAWLARAAARFDVVHVHGMFNPISSFAASIASNRHTPVVLRPFGTLSQYTFTYRRSTLKRAWFRTLEQYNLRRASALHFTSAVERDDASRHRAVAHAAQFIVPPPFDFRATQLPDRPSGPPTAVTICRLHPVKNIEALLHAWVRVRQMLPTAQLVIAGTGDAAYVSHLQAITAALSLRDSVRLPGFADSAQKAELLGCAHAFVLPSHFENFGVAIIEAAVHGVPVVTTSSVGVSAFIARNGLGIVSSPERDELADSIVTALTDLTLWSTARNQGPAAVDRELSISAIAPALRAMYEFTAKAPS